MVLYGCLSFVLYSVCLWYYVFRMLRFARYFYGPVVLKICSVAILTLTVGLCKWEQRTYYGFIWFHFALTVRLTDLLGVHLDSSVVPDIRFTHHWSILFSLFCVCHV